MTNAVPLARFIIIATQADLRRVYVIFPCITNNCCLPRHQDFTFEVCDFFHPLTQEILCYKNIFPTEENIIENIFLVRTDRQ